MKILLVEDDISIGNAINEALVDNSHTVNWVTDGDSAVSTLGIETYSVVLLDIGLPDKNGFEVLKNIRHEKIEVPVIIITARDSVDDKIKGLDIGADDYLVKPFSLRELDARIRAVVRRKNGKSDNCISIGNIQLNINSKNVLVGESLITLTAKEYTLLYELLNNAGSILSREQLEEKLYGWNEEIASNSLEFLIHGVRKKIGKQAIKNIRGLGWMISN